MHDENVELPVFDLVLLDGSMASFYVARMCALRCRAVNEIEPLAVGDFLVFLDLHFT
jgi:hypothetical protein